MALPPKYKVHPAIGIARLGDASTYFIGPESPGFPPAGAKPGGSVPPYKDGGRIKPQAARFRVFEYVDRGGKYEVSREVDLTQGDVDFVSWSVLLANRKASFFNFNGLAGFDRKTSGRRNSKDAPPRIKHKGPRKNLEINPGERSISGISKGPVHFTSKDPAKERWPDPKPVPEITTLGRLYTDDAGRLIVLGGSGVTGRRPAPGSNDISDYANNDGWFDDVSDGPVTALIGIGGQSIPVEPAWVICAPPDFAPSITGVVTLYDVLYDIGARELALPSDESTYVTGELKRLGALSADFKANKGKMLTTFQPDFDTEIYPILLRAVNMQFVFGPAVGHHSFFGATWAMLASKDAASKAIREAVLGYLRPPDGAAAPAAGTRSMPKLLGDEPYRLKTGAYDKRARVTLTITQYEIMKRWAAGAFVASGGAPAPPKAPPPITPEGLDRAALENCVGAGMYPGIEASWQIRYPSIYKEPFRINPAARSPYLGDKPGTIVAGHFTRQMALPWQADFLMCKLEHEPSGPYAGDWGWWPSQRPDAVYASKKDFTDGKPSVPWHRSTKGGVVGTWSSGSTPDYEEMLANWTRFGFIVDLGGGAFVEQEREPDIPP
jgi:L-lysine epsilon oxidase-like protein